MKKSNEFIMTDQDNAACYFDFLEALESVVMEIAALKCKPSENLINEFRDKFERYISRIIKNDNPAEVQKVCSVFAKFIKKSLYTKTVAVIVKKVEFQPKSELIFEDNISAEVNENQLMREMQISDSDSTDTDNINHAIVDDKPDIIETKSVIVINEIELSISDRDKRNKTDIDNALSLCKRFMEFDPENEFVFVYFMNIKNLLDDLSECKPLCNYCNDISSEVRILIEKWKKLIDTLLEENPKPKLKVQIEKVKQQIAKLEDSFK